MRFITFLLIILLPFLYPDFTSAHAFGQQYTLPVPFWLYAYGAAATLLVSFLLIGFFMNGPKKSAAYPKKDITSFFLIRLVTNDSTKIFLKVISIMLFFLTLLSGFLGVNTPYANINMTLFWIIFLLGTTYATAIIGNIYSVLNPWKILTEILEHILGKSFKPVFIFPKILYFLPALIAYFFLIYIELITKIGPFDLSLLLFIYSLLTFFGVFIFGKNMWFEYGELFSVFFRLISYVAPIGVLKNNIYIRPPFLGILGQTCTNNWLVLFVLFMLSSTALDGFRETTSWWNLFFSLVRLLHITAEPIWAVTFTTLGLLLSPFVFLIMYIIFLLFMKLVVKTKHSLSSLAMEFAFSLIPIGFVYNVAHYYTLFVIQGQDIIRLISDPFGFGWNLFNTDSFTPNVGLIDTNTIWHSQVFFLLVGHVAGVFIAHTTALIIYPSAKKALLSQFPMLILMIMYTVIGLWILSQPLTGN